MSKKKAYLIFGFVSILLAIPTYFYYKLHIFEFIEEYQLLRLPEFVITLAYTYFCIKLGLFIFARDKKD